MASTLSVKIEPIPFSRSPVSIIIPFHGQYQKVTELVTSIWQHTKGSPFEVVLVDDFSDNVAFFDDLKKATLPQTKVVRTSSHLGFGGAIEYGFGFASQAWIVILGSDCRIETSDWLIELGQSMLKLKDSGIKMISSRMSSAEGYSKRLISKPFEKQDDYVMTDEDGCLPLNCVMVHRDLFTSIGFIKNYPFCGYEDEEIAFRMKHFGFKQAISGKSYVHHFGSATIKSHPEFIKIMEKNRELCISDMKKLKFR